MNLGQTMLVVAAISILGILVLNANRTVLETNETQNQSEFGITAVSLATSLVEEANGKMFDEVIEDSTTLALTDPSQLTASASLGKEAGEAYRSGVTDFDDFDDFDRLFLVYKSPLDSALTPGSSGEITVPGIREKYYVKCRVQYVASGNLDAVVTTRTWHKKITVTVSAASPTMKDTLVYPAVMSYWN
jgi:hypothetical protein